MNHETGKSCKLNADDMSLMQDMVAAALEMERGTSKAETDIKFAKNAYRSFFTDEEATAIKATMTNLAGEHGDHRAIGKWLMMAAKEDGNLTERAAVRTAKEVDDVALGKYDHRIKRNVILEISGCYNNTFKIRESIDMSNYINKLHFVVEDELTTTLKHIKKGLITQNDLYFPIQKSLDIIAKHIDGTDCSGSTGESIDERSETLCQK